ncbi:hypothetical protein WA538_004636 [Blastocystis sp. DL]
MSDGNAESVHFSRKRSHSKCEDDMMDVYNKIPCIAKNDETGYRVSDRPPTPLSSTDSVNVNETVVQPVSHNILSFSISLPSDAGAFYRNPFRELDVSSLPLEFQRRLTEFPFLTQIAILKNSELQKRFFPEYCSYRVGDDRGSVWRDSCDSLRN